MCIFLGDSTDMGTEAIGSILENALETTSCQIGLGTDPGKICQDDGDKTWSMFCIEYLDKEKFGDTKRISDINQLVSINRLLLRLRWSLDKLIEDYVRASKGEEDAEHDQDICAWYFAYEDRYIFEEENAKPFGNSLTKLDDIPYADGVTECNAAMEIFLNKFLRQIRSTNDNSILQYGDAGIMLQNLRDHALLMKEERMESFAHKKIKDLSQLESRLIAAYDANSPGACSWGRRWMMPTDALLFRIEREALRKIVSSPEHDVIENMDRVAAPEWLYRIRNNEDAVLEKAIKGFNKSEKPETRAGVIDMENLRRKIQKVNNELPPFLKKENLVVGFRYTITYLWVVETRYGDGVSAMIEGAGQRGRLFLPKRYLKVFNREAVDAVNRGEGEPLTLTWDGERLSLED
ncbi:uncharacterized protein LOC124170052 [Ischnura elegans]|uniref:uncharacterized protein LOC124170052 n=1 Tax=Ischnura elegans TaxID=197161 RepID=UPI001ED8A4A1|nr:uncharacterized protein LOC124170052 [Ischnura elegans]